MINLCENKEGFLAVVGDNGMTKALMVSRKLLDDEFVLRQLNVDIVAWLNVYDLSSKGMFIDAKRFFLLLAESVGLAINQNNELSPERQLERYFQAKDKQVMVVLENSYNGYILQLLSVFEKHLRVIVIAPNVDLLAGTPSRYKHNVISLSKVPINKMENLFNNSLPLYLDRIQLTSLAMLTDGLPQLAQMIISQFLMCQTVEESNGKYKFLVDRNPDQQFVVHSPRMCPFQSILDQSQYLSDIKVDSNIIQILKLNFDRECRDVFRRYCAFLWFGIDEVVQREDLALIWGCDEDEVVPYCNQHFCDRGLIQKVKIFDGTNESSEQQMAFQMHGMLFGATAKLLQRRSKTSKLFNFIEMAKTAGKHYPGRLDGENILHLAVRLKKRSIFTAVLNFVSGDAEIMLELLEHCESTNHLTPIECLAQLEWNDDKEVFTYKNTTLGLLLLAYEKLSISKVKPSPYVESLIVRCRQLMDNILKHILKICSDKDDLLLMAARENYTEMARIFIEMGAYYNTRDKDDGNTALTLFARHGNEEMVVLLCQRGQQLQNNTWAGTAMVKAVAIGHRGIVELLLERGVSPNSVDDDGESALLKAIKTRKVDMVRLLLSYGADANINEKNIHTDRFNSNQNCSALMLAIEMNEVEMVKWLLHHNADANAKNHFGLNCLELARRVETSPLIIEMVRNAVKPKYLT